MMLNVVGNVVAPGGSPVTGIRNDPVGVSGVVEISSSAAAPAKEGVTDDRLNKQEAPFGREMASQDKVTF